MKTLDYLEALKNAAPRPTVYAVAQLLDIPEQTVRSWSKGRRFPDGYACARIAEALDMPIEQVWADIQAESEKDEGRKAYWEGLARKFAACLVMGSAIATGPKDANSATEPARRYTESEFAYVSIMGLVRSVIELCVRGFRRFPGQLVELAS